MRERIAPPWAFCALLEGETLLDRTRRRADLLAHFDHQTVVAVRAHEPTFTDLRRELPPDRVTMAEAS